MGKTYKRFPHSYFRRPRGKKQALIAGVRPKAVPPDSWDDKSFDGHVWMPYKVAKKLWKRCFPKAEAIRRIRRKFNLSHCDAREVVELYYLPPHYKVVKKDMVGILRVADIEEVD